MELDTVVSTTHATRSATMAGPHPALSAREQREHLWDRLRTIFSLDRPDTEQLAVIATLAEVAIDQVFAARRISPADQDREHGLVHDYAEASALYGFTLGLHMGRQQQD